MRIATSTLYDRGLSAINNAQENLSRAQEQVSTGKRVNRPSDDPVAAAGILRTTSALATNTQYVTNQNVATGLLAQTDSTLGQVGDLLTSVRTTLISANNAALSDSDRAALATELKSRLDTLVSLANTTDGNGQFLFAGSRSGTAPFSRTTTGATYAGDDGSRSIQVSATRQMESTVNGADVFNRVTTGNGVFTTAAAATNTGSASVDVGQVVLPASLTGHAYQLRFSVAAGATTYQVIDTTTNAPVAAPALSGNNYTPGTALNVDGMQFTVGGTPANGDVFTVAPSNRQSVFDTLQAAVSLLAQPTNGAAGRAQVTTGILGAIANVDNAIGNNLNVRATVGVRQNELDALASSAGEADISGKAQLSHLQDTDYASAVAELSKQQAALSAAQKTFTMIGNKTLFDYL